MEDTLALLRGIEVLTMVDTETLETVAAAMTRRRIEAGEVIVRQGEPACRHEVVPDPEVVAARRAALEARREARKLTRLERRSPRSRWWPWADLLGRVFDVDGWQYPSCAGPMRLRAVVVGPPATMRILTGVGGTSRGPLS